MLKFLLFFSFLFISLNSAFSVEVNINLTASYAQDVWYSFENGVIKSEPKDNWDIAFQTGQNAAILLNSQKGNKIFVVPNSDLDTYDTVIDTTGMSTTWESPSNSVETWSVGAFNINKNGFEENGDFGWGYYDPNTHTVQGSKTFILQLSDKSVYKFAVEGLVSNIYTIKWANLDGSNPQTADISKKDLVAKNFIYYSLKTKTLNTEREPNSNEWALLFSKYTGMINNGTTTVAYTVTGVRTNKNYRTAKVTGVPVVNAVAPKVNDENYSYKITEIGDNWKKFVLAENKYVMIDSVTYFVTNESNDVANPKVYKINFKSFEGSSTGKLSFDLNLTTDVEENFENSNVILYPSVVSKNGTLNLDLNELSTSDVNVKVLDLTGRTVFANNYSNFGNKFNFNIDNLNSGSYYLILELNGKVISEKFIVE